MFASSSDRKTTSPLTSCDRRSVPRRATCGSSASLNNNSPIYNEADPSSVCLQVNSFTSIIASPVCPPPRLFGGNQSVCAAVSTSHMWRGDDWSVLGGEEDVTNPDETPSVWNIGVNPTCAVHTDRWEAFEFKSSFVVAVRLVAASSSAHEFQQALCKARSPQKSC